MNSEPGETERESDGYGQNAVSDDPAAVIEGIEADLDQALSKLNRAEQKIDLCQNRLRILTERDDIRRNDEQ
ncbi:hypothetical protein [Halocatena marina]|uniref:Uncharacterized protein n=1 Tax=Halocatena marina TaxID=2934937 RepID=A0ABD5YJ58_9EURY|nr:hypothetical protein [Halocatena marina]